MKIKTNNRSKKKLLNKGLKHNVFCCEKEYKISLGLSEFVCVKI